MNGSVLIQHLASTCMPPLTGSLLPKDVAMFHGGTALTGYQCLLHWADVCSSCRCHWTWNNPNYSPISVAILPESYDPEYAFLSTPRGQADSGFWSLSLLFSEFSTMNLCCFFYFRIHLNYIVCDNQTMQTIRRGNESLLISLPLTPHSTQSPEGHRSQLFCIFGCEYT